MGAHRYIRKKSDWFWSLLHCLQLTVFFLASQSQLTSFRLHFYCFILCLILNCWNKQYFNILIAIISSKFFPPVHFYWLYTFSRFLCPSYVLFLNFFIFFYLLFLKGNDVLPAELLEKGEMPKVVFIGFGLAALLCLLLGNAALFAWFIIRKRSKGLPKKKQLMSLSFWC